LKLLSENCDLVKADHIDYWAPMEVACVPLIHFNIAKGIRTIAPTDMGLNSWRDLWHESAILHDFGHVGDSYAFENQVSLFKASRMHFRFFGTDAIKTFELLLKTEGPPTFLVLQDHGDGGNWTRFGRGGELEQLATSLGLFPKFLFVADNTEAWEGYEQVTEYVVYGGQMHTHARALYLKPV
jgi:hypothetical protein